MNGLWNGLIAGALTAGLMGGFLYLLRYSIGLQFLIVALVCMLVWIIVFFILASARVRAIRKRINSLENTTGIDLNGEQFRSLTKELLLGRQWLVYRKKLDFRFWTKPVIEDIDVQPKSFGNRTVITIKTKGSPVPEVLRVTSQDQLGYELQTWFYQNNNAS